MAFCELWEFLTRRRSGLLCEGSPFLTHKKDTSFEVSSFILGSFGVYVAFLSASLEVLGNEEVIAQRDFVWGGVGGEGGAFSRDSG